MRNIVLGLLACSLMVGIGRPVEAATLADGQTLTIVVGVVDQNGAPIPDADVAFVWGSLITHHQTDAHGIYTTTGPAGAGGLTQYGICAAHHRFGPDRRDACIGAVTVPPSGTYVVDVVIDLSGIGGSGSAGTAPPTGVGRGWITGAITLAATATPISGVSVQLASTPINTTTSSNGRYQFPAISTTDGANGGPTYTVTLTPPPGYVVVGAVSQTVTVVAGQGTEADFTLAPAFTAFWVESFAPDAPLWSSPDANAVAFGTRQQWSHFLVVQPQHGVRLFVWDPASRNYAWLDAANVGPSGPPPGA